jgi:hypothetical protein
VSIKARLKSAKQRLDDYTREHDDGCVCRYVEIVEGEPLTDELRKQVEANVLCFEHHKHTRSHVGFSTVIIVQQRPPLADGEYNDAPLVA